jgi:radical SAM superfamily enzyme YgiQ (UPF0313 family)
VNKLEQNIKKVVILSIPYTVFVPAPAPVLLSACLKKAGIDAIGIDFSSQFHSYFYQKPYWEYLKTFLAEGQIDNKFNYRRAVIDVIKYTKKTLIDIKKTYNPEIIGLSIFTSESLNFFYTVIPYIRKYLPDTLIMIGGRGLESICRIENIPHYQKIHNHGMADIIVIGDAESEIIKVVQEKKLGINFSPIQTKQDLDDIPSATWEDYDLTLYDKLQDLKIVADKTGKFVNPKSMVVTASKGCVRKCTFCDVAHYWPNYIFRDGENVANDIIKAYQHTKITNFEFTDNLINGSVPNYRKMNLKLAQTIPDTINYGGYAIFRDKQSMTSEDFELASRAGCRRWSIGIESGSERIRKEMRKNFSNDDIRHGAYFLSKNNIMQHWMLITGYPSETEEDVKETVNLLHEYKHLANKNLLQIGFTLPFQLNDFSPLMKEDEYKSKYNWNESNLQDIHYKFFWTTSANPENNFNTRYKRWIELTSLAEQLGYNFFWTTDVKKYTKELENLKNIYDQKNSKVIYISKIK